MTNRRTILLLLMIPMFLTGHSLWAQDGESPAANEPMILVPKGLSELKHPEDNPPSLEKIALGKQLYFDKRLSSDGTISCASCHDPKKGWSNGEANAEGVDKQRGGRSAPTIINTAYNRFHFWDGRAGSLEEQALGPIANPIEMNLPIEEAVARVNAVPSYREQFENIFGGPATPKRIGQAIAAFERTILSGDAPYDRYKAGDEDALSESAQRGFEIFFNKAVCSACHVPPNFTDNAFHNVGIGMDKEEYDAGREVISKLGGDRGSFKTPTLREIARTAPYMHDGSMKTLEDVVAHYNKGGVDNPWLDEEIFPLRLTEQEKKDLVQFLKEGLSSENYPEVKPPTVPPFSPPNKTTGS